MVRSVSPTTRNWSDCAHKVGSWIHLHVRASLSRLDPQAPSRCLPARPLTDPSPIRGNPDQSGVARPHLRSRFGVSYQCPDLGLACFQSGRHLFFSVIATAALPGSSSTMPTAIAAFHVNRNFELSWPKRAP